MEIKINGTISFNGEINQNINQEKNEESFKNLLNNTATFRELLAYLRDRAKAGKTEEDKVTSKDQDSLVKAKRCPGSEQLRNGYPLVAKIAVGEATCEVYENAYAIVDNGDRKTVVWVPDCTKAARYYSPMTYDEKCKQERERQGEDEEFNPADAEIIEGTEPGEDRLTEEMLADMEWYLAVIIAGENRIEANLEHPMSAVNRSDGYTDGFESTARYSWNCGARFENPEDAVIRKEEEAERCAELTDKQREAYEMYFEDGLTQAQIAERLGTSQRAISDRLEAAKKKIAEYYQRNL